MLGLDAATAEELDALPDPTGHGFEIVRTCKECGGFTDLRQLGDVPGLGGKTGGIAAALIVSSRPG